MKAPPRSTARSAPRGRSLPASMPSERGRSVLEMSPSTNYPIGRPGVPWGDAERQEWLSRQRRHRSYQTDVLERIERLRSSFEVTQYGQLDYSPDTYPLFSLR